MKKWLNSLISSWYHALTLLWIILIAVQWLSFTSTIWFVETNALVLATLVALAVIEIVLPNRPGWKLAAKAAAVFIILYRTLSSYSIISSSGWPGSRIGEFIDNLTPYLWFSLIAWLILELIPLVVTTKQRILVFLGINIIAFGILDSFTPSILWQEVAWIVFAGMGWLVSKHFQNFSLRYPQGWKHLRRSPFKIAANIAIIFSLVIVAGVNMPEVPPTVTDPYTAWRNYNGAAAVTMTGGTGSLNQQMNTESGYSRQDNRLGGGFNFDYSPVMNVITSQRSYWRGETRRVYTGTGWAEDANRRSDFETVRANEELQNEDHPKIETEQVVQTVNMASEESYPVLFGAYSINRVQSIDGSTNTDWLNWKPEQSEMHWNSTRRGNPFPRTYTIISEVPIVPEAELRKQTFDDLYSGRRSQIEEYLQIPDDFPERVTELAGQITATADTPYEKVGLLQQYLQKNYTYTNNPDISRAQSDDFVESFLFDIREGYCDYYSTSLVMMARSLGIPARWVKGYAPGQQVFLDDAQEAANGENMTAYAVSNADAHSWAEVYFGDYGWIPVEATPGFDMPLLTQQEEAEPVTAPEIEEEQPQQEEQEMNPADTNGEVTINTGIVWAAVAVLMLWAGYIIWRNRIKLHFYILNLRAGRPLSPGEKVVVETERWLRYMQRKGWGRGTSETLRESVTRWERETPELSPVLRRLLQVFEKARYSPSAAAEEDWLAVRAHAAELRAAMKSMQANVQTESGEV